MADLGPERLLVNAQNARLFLGIGGGKDEWVQLTNIKPHFGLPEFREPLTDGRVRYFYGLADHYFEANMLGTTDQLSNLVSLGQLNPLGNIPIPNQKYTIETTARDGTVAKVEVDGFLRDFDQEANEEGFLEYRCFFRITNNVITVS